MKNFIFKSPDSDLQKMFTILNSNILYITHTNDKILKILNEYLINDKLQKQVVDFYSDNDESVSEEDKEPD